MKAYKYIENDFQIFIDNMRVWINKYNDVDSEIRYCNSYILFLYQMNDVRDLVCEIEKKYGKNILFIITEQKNSFWVHSARIKEYQFDMKCPLKKEWRGLEGSELVMKSGLKTASFIHASGHVGMTFTREDAIKLCEESKISNN